MRLNKLHMVFLTDETKTKVGIITMEDLLEELVGNIYDEFDPQEEQDIIRLDDGRWRVSGSANLEELFEAMGRELPEDDERDYDTLGGLVFAQLSVIPEDGSRPVVETMGLRIRVEELCERRVEWALVEKLEAMSADERYEFWRGELSRCIRCNACRDVCPACTCEKCVFDNPQSGVENKAITDSFEEKMFHIIRAFHVAGRCTDCGECSRVCPQHIPLHLLNRKFIKDINSFYGEYQAGAEVGSRAPLVDYTTEDMEPSEAVERGNV